MKKKRYLSDWLAITLLCAVFALGAGAQVATTTIQDSVYRADGTPAGGSVVVSWSAFTTAAGNAVAAGTTAATIGQSGVLTVTLAANAGATPTGSSYTAVFHLDDGTTSREYWVIPASAPGAPPLKLSAVQSAVLPASVAMQTASKTYVDRAIAAAVSGQPLSTTSIYVEKAGDTMTGPLVLPGDPATTYQAADKHYVDVNVAAATSGLSSKVDLLPGTTQQVQQPSGTELDVNNFNGALYASQQQTANGGNGIANSIASPDCSSAHCDVHVESTYASAETLNQGSLPAGGHVTDLRGGSVQETVVDPHHPTDGSLAVAHEITVVGTVNNGPLSNSGAITETMHLRNFGLAGGNNQFPEGVENMPYFKSTYSAMNMEGTYYTEGQHVLDNHTTNCFGVGDCLIGSQFIYASGGTRDAADEGAHPYDLQITEDYRLFSGYCTSGCTPGSTVMTINAVTGAGTAGEGRFLIDKAASKVISVGQLIGGYSAPPFAKAVFSGTNFALSVLLQTNAAATSQPRDMAPGTVTLPIATGGVGTGYATSTAALPAATGIACVADPHGAGSVGFANYEMTPYTAVDATHMQLTLKKVHAIGATIAVGGLCGYGLEQTVDTVSGFRQVFPVVASISATQLMYADARTPIVGAQGSTTAFRNIQYQVASIARQNGVVTLTIPGGFNPDVNGLKMTVSGVADPSYNGQFVVTTTSNNTLTYASSGPDSSSSGGSLTFLTGGYVLYPMAEVLGVMNPATKAVDGYMQLAPNTVAWDSADPLEVPHYYQEDVAGDVTYVTQFVPRPNSYDRAGMEYRGTVGPGMRGWSVTNSENASDYIGNGGTHALPDTAYEARGAWSYILETQAGDQSVFRIDCNSHGCNKWNSAYDLFEFQGASRYDTIAYNPQVSQFVMGFGGAVFSYGSNGFTTDNINVNFLNAGHITGGVDGGAIATGTINAARLPLFGPSGATHGVGAVPDPGPIAGNTRYLREDGTWVAPPSGSGGASTGSAGGDLSGTYPNPTVSAVHATSGTVDGVSVGGKSAAPVRATMVSLAGSGGQYLAFNEDSVACKFCNYFSAGGPQWGQGQRFFQMFFVANSGGGAGALPESIGFLVGRNPNAANAADTSWQMWSNALLGQSTNSIGWSGSATAAGTTGASPSQAAGFSYTGSAVSCDTSSVGDGRCALQVGELVGGGAAPSVAAGTAAGSGAAATATGSSLSGVLSLTTGSGTGASATALTVTFANVLRVAPQGCSITARNATAASVATSVYTTAPTTSGWSLAIGAAALPAATMLQWSYVCL